ncbi:hypothetical protein [Alienimonas chondri]|uniref:Uncharacterized protein n=1 Tax=Alienimonas chondri TaxID=2681879 RepID=A0ABX1VD91_9PLAN|nr:hypothetical protein [Alienimonas chondri]NNJ26079.1 hypothetical protein [Alienimonas chondri]
MQRPAVGGRLSRWLRRRADGVVELDRFETLEIAESYRHALPALSAYFKRNLRTADVNRNLHNPEAAPCYAP